MKNEYEVKGDETILYVECKGQKMESLISTNDLDRVKELNGRWYAFWSKSTNSFYVCGYLGTFEGKVKKVQLHRWLLNPDKKSEVDHINHNTLDNTRKNLRVVSHAENTQNRKLNARNTSGYRGVSWERKSKKWRAAFMLNYKCIVVGLFDNPEDANEAVIKARKTYMPYSKESLESKRKAHG